MNDNYYCHCGSRVVSNENGFYCPSCQAEFDMKMRCTCLGVTTEIIGVPLGGSEDEEDLAPWPCAGG